MKRSDKCVFLLGAGFSADYKQPVMSKFMQRARRRYSSRIDEGKKDRDKDSLLQRYKGLFDFTNKLRNAASIMTLNWENLEHLYTQADLLKTAGLEDGQRLCDDIRWAIWNVYQKDYSDSLVPLSCTIQKINESTIRPVIITTNYDTVCEKSLQNSPGYYYHGFEIPTEDNDFAKAPKKKNKSNLNEPKKNQKDLALVFFSSGEF